MSDQIFKIQLSNVPQEFDVEIAEKQFVFETRWNAENPSWELFIKSTASTLLAGPIPLVAGVNLIGQYPNLSIAGTLAIYTQGNQNKDSELESIGDSCNLYYIPN